MQARIRELGVFFAAGVPLVAALSVASPDGYWLDGSEFVAAGVWLGVSHPPGQPLAVLWSYLWTLFPMGPLAFRVAVGSATAAALASACLFRALRQTIAVVGLNDEMKAAPIALFGTYAVVGSFGFFIQAVRPEVYALQAALAFYVLECLVRYHQNRPQHSAGLLYRAAFAAGLSLVNHHFLAILLMPAMAPVLALATRSAGLRTLWTSAGLAAAGLVGYLYLPARAASGTSLNLGDPDSWSRFYWVVSAQVYQKNQGSGVPQPLEHRFLDVLEQLITQLPWPLLLMAVVGAYVLLRMRRGRGVGVLWLLVLFVFAAARGWLGFVQENPDALGYLLPAFGAMAALACAFVAVLVLALARIRLRAVQWLTQGACLLLAGWGVFLVAVGMESASLRGFYETDAFTEVERQTLPNRALVLVFEPQTAFRLSGAQAAFGFRPDVTVVPMPFLAYPGVAQDLVEDEPHLKPLFRHVLLEGSLTVPSLQDVAKIRPLLAEMDARVPLAAYRTLVPSYTHHAVLGSEAYREDRRPGRLLQDKGWQLLEGMLRSSGSKEGLQLETRRRLLWRSYHEALYFADAGSREAALSSVGRGLFVFPATRELLLLKTQLEASSEGEPIDVRPFHISAPVEPETDDPS